MTSPRRQPAGPSGPGRARPRGTQAPPPRTAARRRCGVKGVTESLGPRPRRPSQVTLSSGLPASLPNPRPYRCPTWRSHVALAPRVPLLPQSSGQSVLRLHHQPHFRIKGFFPAAGSPCQVRGDSPSAFWRQVTFPRGEEGRSGFPVMQQSLTSPSPGPTRDPHQRPRELRVSRGDGGDEGVGGQLACLLPRAHSPAASGWPSAWEVRDGLTSASGDHAGCGRAPPHPRQVTRGLPLQGRSRSCEPLRA